MVYTRKRKSFNVTPGKLESLRESLVEMRETPKRRGEPEHRKRMKSYRKTQCTPEKEGVLR